MLVSRLSQKKRGLSINPDIHHSKVPRSGKFGFNQKMSKLHWKKVFKPASTYNINETELLPQTRI